MIQHTDKRKHETLSGNHSEGTGLQRSLAGPNSRDTWTLPMEILRLVNVEIDQSRECNLINHSFCIWKYERQRWGEREREREKEREREWERETESSPGPNSRTMRRRWHVLMGNYNSAPGGVRTFQPECGIVCNQRTTFPHLFCCWQTMSGSSFLFFFPLKIEN